MSTGNEVKAEAEAFTTATVAFCEDTKHLKPTDDVLDMETEAGQGAVSTFFLVRQPMMLAGFSGQEAVSV